MIYVMELDVTFSTGLHELPALVGNEGARETAMIEIKRKYISALLTKREVKIARYWSVKNSTATFVLKNTSDPNKFFGRPDEVDSQRKLFEIQRQTFFTNTRNSYGNKKGGRKTIFFCCTDFSCCTETLMSTKFIEKLNMTWLDNVHEQHRSFNMRVRSLGVGVRDLWCVKVAKNSY